MPSLPRVITIDPTWTLSRIVRSATDLLDEPIIQVDVPHSDDALEELQRGGAQLVITSWSLDDEMQGLPLALTIKQASPETAIIIIGSDDSDPQSVDEETAGDPPFVYLRRPVDVHQFLRVLHASLHGEDINAAFRPAPVQDAMDHGPLPPLDAHNARSILKKMLSEAGAMALLLAARTGDILVEEGAAGYINREQMVQALVPALLSTIQMSPLVGGQAQTMHFYDGETIDVFVFSVGLHHLLAVIYDGQAGNRQFGNVRNIGRRAVNDLVALMGASAFLIQREEAPVQRQGRTAPKRKTTTNEIEKIELARAEIEYAAPAPVQLDPIQNLDLSIFDSLDAASSQAADDLFNLDRLAALVSNDNGRKEISFDEAIELGLVSNTDADGGG